VLISAGVFIANRGEIALRVASTCALFPLPGSAQPSAQTALHALAVASAGEADAAHMLAVPPAHRTLLHAAGVRAYLDAEALVAAAKGASAWGVHPGYGFLSESPAFAQAVQAAGLVWIGPDPAHLARFGEKTSARRLAAECSVPTLPGTAGDAASLEQVRAFAQTLPRGAKVMIKAVAGGGGRGMRVVPVDDGEAALSRAYESCAREAGAAFGDARLYAERYLENARHIEVSQVMHEPCAAG
jgi:acetyl/propionyl-CoA carboxylase alpha subunit